MNFEIRLIRHNFLDRSRALHVFQRSLKNYSIIYVVIKIHSRLVLGRLSWPFTLECTTRTTYRREKKGLPSLFASTKT